MPKDEVLRMEIIWLHHNVPIVEHEYVDRLLELGLENRNRQQ